MAKLTAKQCANVSEAGKYADGGGLYLYVMKNGAKYWRAAYRFDGKQKTASYGVYPEVSLKDARTRHALFKSDLAAGIDPMAEKKAIKQEVREDDVANFYTIAQQWFTNTSRAKGWGDKHIKKINHQLKNHVLPAFGDRDIRHIRPVEIVEVVQDIEKQGKITTAYDCLDIIRRICAYAVQLEIRETSPAAHLKDILRREEAEPMRHVLEPQRIGEILLTLERANTTFIATKAYVRLMPMLFTRPTELRLMRWDELQAKDLWVKPASTMKKNRTHAIPLPRQAISIIEEMRLHTGRFDYVFTNPNTGQPISEGAAQRLKIRHGLHDEITWHGWRHTASTLLNEQQFNSDHIELQLAHADKNNIRGTYNHAQYLDQRREMMQAWADYLDQLKGEALAREAAK